MLSGSNIGNVPPIWPSLIIPSLPLSSHYLFGESAAGRARQPSVLSGVGKKIARVRGGAAKFDVYMNRPKRIIETEVVNSSFEDGIRHCC
jgi:hypothetical protein